MDEHRFRELEQKRDTVGLTADEANELGRMMAEREGKEYGNARDRDHPDALPEEPGEHKPASVPELDEMREQRDVRETEEKAS